MVDYVGGRAFSNASALKWARLFLFDGSHQAAGNSEEAPTAANGEAGRIVSALARRQPRNGGNVAE